MLLRGTAWLSPVLLLALAACGSSEPSASDIDRAVRAHLSQSYAQLQQISGTKSPIGEIHSVKKLGCKSDTDVSWRCDVEIDLSQLGERGRGPVLLRFVKGSDGWTLAQ